MVIDQWEKIQVDKESSMDWLVRPYQGPLIGGANVIITSRVSGRGYRIGAVFLSVCKLALSWPNRLTYNEFWGERTRKYPTREEHEHSGVFIKFIIGSV